VKFSQELPDGSPFAPRDLFRNPGSPEGTRALAREFLMSKYADYAAASKGNAVKRANLWMLKRNACVVPGNVGMGEDLAILEAMQSHQHEMVREHAAWGCVVLARNVQLSASTLLPCSLRSARPRNDPIPIPDGAHVLRTRHGVFQRTGRQAD